MQPGDRENHRWGVGGVLGVGERVKESKMFYCDGNQTVRAASVLPELKNIWGKSTLERGCVTTSEALLRTCKRSDVD